MIQIRAEQYEVFERTAHKQFEDDMVAHLREFSPKHTEGIGEPSLREVVRLGLTRARGYGFSMRGSLQFYLELMIMFGSDCDTDPMLPWINAQLKRRGGNELDRADRIHGLAFEFKDRVLGPKLELEVNAIRRLLAKSPQDWLSEEMGNQPCESVISSVYPEKCEQAGPDGLRTLCVRGNQEASARGPFSSNGALVLTALMVAFGHGCFTDPQFGWIGSNLRSTLNQPPRMRLEKLTTRALAYLSDGIGTLERG